MTLGNISWAVLEAKFRLLVKMLKGCIFTNVVFSTQGPARWAKQTGLMCARCGDVEGRDLNFF